MAVEVPGEAFFCAFLAMMKRGRRIFRRFSDVGAALQISVKGQRVRGLYLQLQVRLLILAHVRI